MVKPVSVRALIGAEGTGTVMLDGQDVSMAVRALTIRSEVGTPTEVELEIAVPRGVTFEGQAMVTLAPATVAVLLAAGWTAPSVSAEAFEELCGARPAFGSLTAKPCERPANHEGSHENYYITWGDE